MATNPMHHLLAAGGTDGIVEFFDSRARKSVSTLDLPRSLSAGEAMEISALKFDSDGLTLGAGTSLGHCALFDLRSSAPVLVKEHQNELPIHSIHFHANTQLGGGSKTSNVISADAKLIKIWDRHSGDALTNIETPSDTSSVHCVKDTKKDSDSGVLLCAGRQERIMSFYVPTLGTAPKWCSWLDTITEELEENGAEEAAQVYENYRFITREEVGSLGLDNAIGTPLLRAYMHGFFVDSRLYIRLKSVAEPFAYEKWRKQKIQTEIEAKRSSRIGIKHKLPKVKNRPYIFIFLYRECYQKVVPAARSTSWHWCCMVLDY